MGQDEVIELQSRRAKHDNGGYTFKESEFPTIKTKDEQSLIRLGKRPILQVSANFTDTKQ